MCQCHWWVQVCNYSSQSVPRSPSVSARRTEDSKQKMLHLKSWKLQMFDSSALIWLSFVLIITIVDNFNLDEYNNFSEQILCACCCSGDDVTNSNGCVSSSAFDSFTPVIYVLRAALFCLLESRGITMPESCYVFSLQFFLIGVWYSSWNDTSCTI